MGVCLTGCATKYAEPVESSRWSKDPVSQLLHTVTTKQEASLGGISSVGVLFVLIGGVAMWVFKAYKTGLGLIVTGVSLVTAAYYLQEYSTTFLVLGIIGVLAAGASLLTKGILLANIKTQATKLFREATNGKPEEGRAAEALLRVGDPKIESAYKAKKKEKSKW